MVNQYSMSLRRLEVPIAKQAPSMCGPYALAAVLRYYGDRVSVSRLIHLTKATVEDGTEPENMVAAARARGFHVFVRAWAELNDLEEALRHQQPPIVLWFSVDEGHYSVVVAVSKRFLYLADPEYGRIHRLPRDVFRRTWFDFDTSEYELHTRVYARWMMVVEPKAARVRKTKKPRLRARVTWTKEKTGSR